MSSNSEKRAQKMAFLNVLTDYLSDKVGIILTPYEEEKNRGFYEEWLKLRNHKMTPEKYMARCIVERDKIRTDGNPSVYLSLKGAVSSYNNSVKIFEMSKEKIESLYAEGYIIDYLDSRELFEGTGLQLSFEKYWNINVDISFERNVMEEDNGGRSIVSFLYHAQQDIIKNTKRYVEHLTRLANSVSIAKLNSVPSTVVEVDAFILAEREARQRR